MNQVRPPSSGNSILVEPQVTPNSLTEEITSRLIVGVSLDDGVDGLGQLVVYLETRVDRGRSVVGRRRGTYRHTTINE